MNVICFVSSCNYDAFKRTNERFESLISISVWIFHCPEDKKKKKRTVCFFVERENDLFQNNCPKRIVSSHKFFFSTHFFSLTHIHCVLHCTYKINEKRANSLMLPTWYNPITARIHRLVGNCCDWKKIGGGWAENKKTGQKIKSKANNVTWRENLFWLRLDLLFANVLCPWCVEWYKILWMREWQQRERERENRENDRPINMLTISHTRTDNHRFFVLFITLGAFVVSFFLYSCFVNYLNNPIVYSGYCVSVDVFVCWLCQQAGLRLCMTNQMQNTSGKPWLHT